MQNSHKHHYLPTFYLKRWASPEGKVVEFSRPYNVVKVQAKYPTATGYEKHLYSVAGLPEEKAHLLEDVFMKKTDTMAAAALQKILSDDNSPWAIEMRSAWTRFLVSLLYRSPESVQRFKKLVGEAGEGARKDWQESYQQKKKPSDPETFDEFLTRMDPAAIHKAPAILLQKIIDNPNVGGFINNMRWASVRFEDTKYSLLTSDCPVVMTNGIKYDHSYIILPVDPFHLITFANNEKQERWLQEFPPTTLIEAVNDAVVRQATKYVYGCDQRQLRFIENRLAKNN